MKTNNILWNNWCGFKKKKIVKAMVWFWQVQRTQCRRLFVAEFELKFNTQKKSDANGCLVKIHTRFTLTQNQYSIVRHYLLQQQHSHTEHIWLRMCALEFAVVLRGRQMLRSVCVAIWLWHIEWANSKRTILLNLLRLIAAFNHDNLKVANMWMNFNSNKIA